MPSKKLVGMMAIDDLLKPRAWAGGRRAPPGHVRVRPVISRFGRRDVRTRRRHCLSLLSPLPWKKRGAHRAAAEKTLDRRCRAPWAKLAGELFSGVSESAINRGAMAGQAELQRAAA